MKTQVIQLDSNDDVVSVRDKMSWAKAERLLLVFPRRSRLLARTLDLRLIARHARALGCRLAVVARSDELRAAARSLGIPVYAAAAAAQREAWTGLPRTVDVSRLRSVPPDGLRRMHLELERPEAMWRKHLASRFAFFSLAVLAVAALLLAVFPAASIHLTPETRLQDQTFTVRASLNATAVSLTGSVPARLTSAFTEGSQALAVSGSVSIPEAAASGSVRFSNLTTAVAGIPAGTVVSTLDDPPVRFETGEDAVIGAGVGKVLDVPVQALEAGSAGNVAAGKLVAIEGELGTSLAVTNPEPMAGGSDRVAPVQTVQDRGRLRTRLLAELLQECKLALPVTLAEGDLLFPQTAALSQVLAETYVPAENQPGEMLSLSMTLQCQAQYASAADLRALAGMVLNASLPEGFSPFSTEAVSLDAGDPVTQSDGETEWTMRVQRLLRADLDPSFVTQLVLGRSSGEAAARLSGALPLATAPEIRLTPSWWHRLPLIPFRIRVQAGN